MGEEKKRVWKSKTMGVSEYDILIVSNTDELGGGYERGVGLKELET